MHAVLRSFVYKNDVLRIHSELGTTESSLIGVFNNSLPGYEGLTPIQILDKAAELGLGAVLFGNILAMDDQTLLLIAVNATITLVTLAVIYRHLVVECVDPGFMRTVLRGVAQEQGASV